jgi:hypothetical protein
MEQLQPASTFWQNQATRTEFPNLRNDLGVKCCPPRPLLPAHHFGYWISQSIRKSIEEIFGWIKPIGGLDQLKVRGLQKANAVFIFALAAYDLVRMAKLLGIPP